MTGSRNGGSTPRARPAGTVRRGASLLALPDDMEVPVGLNRRGKPMIVWQNRFLAPAPALERLDRESWLAWWPAPGTPARPMPDWAVNHLTDADFYARGLAAHDDWLGTSVPVFNHPRAIAQTRRDLSARRMAGVPGLIVPPCVRFVATGPEAFAAAFARHGFRFPVIVRPCGGQGGKGQIRVDGVEGWQAAADTPWFGAPHFITQFEDVATAEGLYVKARVVFVAGQAYLRHVKFATGWQVHNRGGGRVADTGETGVIDRLTGDAGFMALCAEVAARTRLDFCGMDIGVDPDRGRYVLFECNAAMSVFFAQTAGRTEEQLARRTRLQGPMEEAVTDLLRHPAQWVAARAGVADLPPVRVALGDAVSRADGPGLT